MAIFANFGKSIFQRFDGRDSKSKKAFLASGCPDFFMDNRCLARLSICHHPADKHSCSANLGYRYCQQNHLRKKRNGNPGWRSKDSFSKNRSD